MKEKIEKIFNIQFLTVFLTIILLFTLTTYWENKTERSIKNWQETNKFEEGGTIPIEKFNSAIQYKDYLWNVAFKKIWTYDLLVLISGASLLVVLRQKNNYERKN